MTTPLVDRGFVRLPTGLIHYRSIMPERASVRRPLVLIHGGPGSSTGLVALMTEIAADRSVIAPDLMGMGESDAAPDAAPTLSSYAEVVAQVLERLGVERFDLYGHHSGAQIACEIAIAHPDRVRGLVLDGLGLFPDNDRVEFKSRYAPAITPDAEGRHVIDAWDFVSNMTLHFPHYRRDEAHRIPGSVVMAPAVLTDRMSEVLKTWRTLHLLYGAAFEHDLRRRLPLVPGRATVLEVERDPLALYAREAAALLRSGVCRPTSPTPAARARVILEALEGAD